MNPLPSSALLIYFKDYEQYHQTPGNKASHFIGIPVVMVSLLGLLGKVILWMPSPDAFFRIDLGILLVIGAGIFSLKLDTKLGIPFVLFAYLSYLLCRHLSLTTLVILQVIGWVAQLYGHYAHEKKSPAFFNSLEHLITGPLWIFAWTIGYYRPPSKGNAK